MDRTPSAQRNSLPASTVRGMGDKKNDKEFLNQPHLFLRTYHVSPGMGDVAEGSTSRSQSVSWCLSEGVGWEPSGIIAIGWHEEKGLTLLLGWLKSMNASCAWGLSTQSIGLWVSAQFWEAGFLQRLSAFFLEGEHLSLASSRCNLACIPASIMKWSQPARHPGKQAYFAQSDTIH
jgi:hypothetical protein